MPITVEAVYEGGVFRPKQPVDLREGAEVRVVIGPLVSEDDDPLEKVIGTCLDGPDVRLAARHDEILYGRVRGRACHDLRRHMGLARSGLLSEIRITGGGSPASGLPCSRTALRHDGPRPVGNLTTLFKVVPFGQARRFADGLFQAFDSGRYSLEFLHSSSRRPRTGTSGSATGTSRTSRSST